MSWNSPSMFLSTNGTSFGKLELKLTRIEATSNHAMHTTRMIIDNERRLSFISDPVICASVLTILHLECSCHALNFEE